MENILVLYLTRQYAKPLPCIIVWTLDYAVCKNVFKISSYVYVHD